jgi:uncharacterized surface protein with fasciclin (FAS1) repeats
LSPQENKFFYHESFTGKKINFPQMTIRAICIGTSVHQQESNAMKLKITILGAAFALATSVSVLASERDIVDTAVKAGQFKTLAAALEAAGLVSTLKGVGPFTVFAPTDEAFAKLPAGTVEDLLKPENKQQLTDLLTYHVVPGKVTAADVAGLDEAKSVNGKMIDVEVDGGSVKVNDAVVTATDVAASNGVIHIIDKVILPPEG